MDFTRFSHHGVQVEGYSLNFRARGQKKQSPPGSPSRQILKVSAIFAPNPLYLKFEFVFQSGILVLDSSYTTLKGADCIASYEIENQLYK